MPVPPAATVVEPSVPVPKEKPVDMAAPAQRPQDAKRGLGRSFRIKAKAGREACSPPQPGPVGTSNSSPGGTKPRREEPPRRRTFQRPRRAHSPPEASPARRELWVGRGGVGWGRRATQSTLGLGLCPRLLSGGRLPEFQQNRTFVSLLVLFRQSRSTLTLFQRFWISMLISLTTS